MLIHVPMRKNVFNSKIDLSRIIPLLILFTMIGQRQAYAESAKAKSVWIEVVGVNEGDKGYNFLSFYQEAASFVQACKQSQSQPECHLFINSDWSLAGQFAKDAEALRIPKSTSPDKQTVLKLVEDSLKNTSGEVVLVLTDHGFMTHTSNSCITINAKESICETDLMPIVANKPAGVKFLINAEGCFGGAFVDVANPEVCAAVRVDRRNGAIAAEGFFWQQLLEKKYSKLSQFNQPPGAGYSGNLILGSEAMKSMMCRTTREKAYKDWRQDLSINEESAWEDEHPDPEVGILPPEKNTIFLDEQPLRDRSTGQELQWLESSSAGFLEFLQQAQAGFSCKAIGWSGDLCSSLQMVLGPVFYEKNQELHSLAKAMLSADAETLKKLIVDFKSKFNDLLASPYGHAWREVESCLFNVERTVTREEQEYQDKQRSKTLTLFPRTFTQQDIEAAQACEAGISF